MSRALWKSITSAATQRRVLRSTELEFFVRQLSALLSAGIPMDQALSAMAAQARPRVAELFESLRTGLREGLSLRQAMAQYPADFDETLRSLVGVGESSGSLAPVLQRAAQAMADANRLRLGLFSALAYPLIVCLVALVVVVALMSYVVPQIVSVLASQQQGLPFLTRALIAVSDLLQAYGLHLLVLLVLLGLGFAAGYRAVPGFRYRVDSLLLQVPLIGPLVVMNESARLASMLSTSVSGGVSLVRALNSAAQVVSNRLLRKRLETATGWVREGAELGRALGQAGGFPPLLVQLIATGERSGQLAGMLGLAADQMGQSIRHKTLLLTTFLEPALILGMGLLVLLIVLAVMMPLIEMNTLLSWLDADVIRGLVV